MANVIPTELRNPRGLQKLKDFYAEQLRSLDGNENAPQLTKLRSDIQYLERELRNLLAAAARK
jgi:hypothetical protein